MEMTPIRKLLTILRLMRHYAKAYDAAPGRQLAEMLILWVRNGIGPLEYYFLGLFRPSVPWREKLNTVSNAGYWRMVQRINPPDVRVLATNKVASNFLLRASGVPTPRIHGVLDRSRGATTDGVPLRNAAELSELVKTRELTGVCLKPIDAWSGTGIVRVEFGREGGRTYAHVHPAGPTLTLEELCDGGYLDEMRLGGYVVQDVLEQHPELARVHPTSLNTLRTWMHQPEAGRWEMYCANLRMGIDGMTVDNSSAGGIAAPVDVETGRLGRAILRAPDPDRATLEEYSIHPTTGVPIEGELVPMWPEVLAVCRRTAELFPFAFMAVDVGLGKEHPWVVEVEADPHSFIQLYCVRGLRPMLEPLLERTK
jgi:hypothetical protein